MFKKDYIHKKAAFKAKEEVVLTGKQDYFDGLPILGKRIGRALNFMDPTEAKRAKIEAT